MLRCSADVALCICSTIRQRFAFADQPARLKELYPNGSWTDIYFEDYFPYPIWRDEEMHALLVDAALHFADAVASSGRPIRSGQHLMLRVDLVLINSDSKVVPPHPWSHLQSLVQVCSGLNQRASWY